MDKNKTAGNTNYSPFLHVSAQMPNLDKQKTTCSRQPLMPPCVIENPFSISSLTSKLTKPFF